MTNEIVKAKRVLLLNKKAIEGAKKVGELAAEPQRLIQAAVKAVLTDLVLESVLNYNSYAMADAVVHSYLREFTNGGSDYAKSSKEELVILLCTILSDEQMNLLKEQKITSDLIKSINNQTSTKDLGIRLVVSGT
tara:strand:+ start:221 stop:625 length:405 start_codon:yes stop_codon:yes gene_type:complete